MNREWVKQAEKGDKKLQVQVWRAWTMEGWSQRWRSSEKEDGPGFGTEGEKGEAFFKGISEPGSL